MKNKKAFTLFSMIFCIFLLVTTFSYTYSRYIFKRDFDVNTSSAAFYFSALEDEENNNIVIQRNMKDELIRDPFVKLEIHNNDGINYNNYDLEYEITIDENPRLTFESGNTTTKVISGKQKRDDILDLEFKVKDFNDKTDSVTITVTPIKPYKGVSKKFTFGIRNEWYIYKIEDLVRLSNNVKNHKTYEDGWILLMNDLDFQDTSDYIDPESKDFGDINNDGADETLFQELTTGSGFDPIGYSLIEEDYFIGNFDGQDFTIDNLYIRKNSELANDENELLGLFGRVKDSTIQNLTIKGSIEVKDPGNHIETLGIAAGLMGKAYGTVTVDNVDNYINVKDEYGRNSMAGIIAEVEDDGIITVKNSNNYGDITNANHTAGIVALVYGSITVENCNNYGTIKNERGSTGMGGIVGVHDNKGGYVRIKNSTNYGTITTGMTTANEMKLGGIIGQCKGIECRIENSDNRGEIISNYNSADPNFLLNGGGIVGRVGAAHTSLNMINCHNYGKITGGYRIGGLLGHINSGGNAVIANSSNEADIIGDYHKHQGYGGVIGYIGGGHAYILNSYNTGHITANGGSSSGIVGNFDGSASNSIVILNSYNIGEMTSKDGNASGILDVDTTTTSKANITLDNVYNGGTISGTTGTYGVGHIVQTTEFHIENVYYKSGHTGSNILTGITEMSETDMKNQDANNTNGLLYKLNTNIDKITITETIKSTLVSKGVITDDFDFTLKRWKINPTSGYPTIIY